MLHYAWRGVMRARVRLRGGLLVVAGLAGLVALGGASIAHPALTATRRTIPASRSGLDPGSTVWPALLANPLPAGKVVAPIADHPLPRLGSSRRSQAVAAPVQPLTISSTGAPPLLGAFAGLSSADGDADPPDPDVAFGNGFLVEVVNSAIRVYRPDGSVLASYDPTTFFQSSSGDLTDPSVVFDASSGRWFASILDSGDGSVRLAVSQTGDPTGAWTVYDHAPGACADQPTLGVSATLVVIGYGGFTLPCRTRTVKYIGGGQYAYSKADLLAGVTAHFTAWDPNPPFGPISAVTSGPDPATSLTLTGPFYLDEITYTGVPSGTTSVTETDAQIVIPDLNRPPGAAQKDGAKDIDTGDIRVRSSMEDPASGTIWATANDGCLPPNDTLIRSCLRVIAIRTGKAVYDRDIAWTGGNLFYGRIAVDGSGNAVVVHGFSSASAFASVGVFALATNGGITPSAPVAVGNEAHQDPRFGDYFGASPDGTGGVWVVGETGTFVTGSSFDWGTTLAHVGASPTLPPPPPPARDTTRPGAQALASTAHRGKTTSLRYRASDNSGETREQVTVYSRGKLVKRISVGIRVTRAGRVYTVGWYAPTNVATPLKFCVVAYDKSRNASAKSCAPIALKA